MATQLELEIDEALRYLSLVPTDQRGSAWHAYLDALLEQRGKDAGRQDFSGDQE
jgi:hypothetical protein